jgi:hypothetical protein
MLIRASSSVADPVSIFLRVLTGFCLEFLLNRVNRALNGSRDAGGQLVARELVQAAPRNLGRFLSRSELRGPRAKSEYQVMMQMKWLALARRNAVDVHAHQDAGARVLNSHSRFFDRLALRRRAQGRILLLDVPAGKQPAVMPVMVHQKHAPAIGIENCRGAGDVAGLKLIAGKRRARMFQQRENQLAAFLFFG